MAKRINLPAFYSLISLHFSGTPLPYGATTTFGYSQVSGGETPTAIATKMLAALRHASGPFASTNGTYSASVILLDCTVKNGPFDTGPEATVADGGGLSGGAGDAVPPNTAHLVDKRTSFGGRHYRGRSFIPGMLDVQVDSAGLIPSASVTALNTRWTFVRTQMEVGGSFLALLHSYDPDLGESPLAPTAITSLAVPARVATQRNRLRR